MIRQARRFLDLCARDLMSENVLSIPVEMTVKAAAHLLAQANISGAPVIDQNDRCIGILSQTDLIHFLDEENAPSLNAGSQCAECYADWQVFDLDSLPGESVFHHMTHNVVSAYPDSPVGDLCRIMHEAHIHRVVIVDEHNRIVGIVSSMDILAAVAAEAAIADGD